MLKLIDLVKFEVMKLAAIEKFSSAFSGGKGTDLDVLDHLEPL